MGLLQTHKPAGGQGRLLLVGPLLFILGMATKALVFPDGGCSGVKLIKRELAAPEAAAVLTGSGTPSTMTASTDNTAAATQNIGTQSAAGAGCNALGADRTKLRSQDFVHVAISHCARAPLVTSHRTWREGMPAFITVDCDEAGLKALNDENAVHKETYAFYRNVSADDFSLGQNPSAGLGYLRAGMTPTLAHRHFGPSYKWMLWGDDDTLFLMPPILRELENLDPEQPWVFSDFCGYHGPHYPRIIPCTYNDTGVDISSTFAVKACTSSIEATANDFSEVTKRYGRPQFPWRRLGGSGYVISVGFMKQLGLDSFESCIQSFVGKYSPGGDLMFSECMPKAGFRFADFGWSIRHRLKYPHRVVNQFGLYEREEFMKTITGATAGSCDEVCQAELAGAVSIHVWVKELKSELFPDPWPLAHSYIVNATKLYNKYAVETLGLPALTSQCSS